jgi:hypothetical protein
MSDPTNVLDALGVLVAEWPKPPWSWDGRFGMVSCAVSGADIELARAVAVRALPHSFDATSLASAPAALRTLVDGCGGLRGNQLVFCDDASAPTAVGLWWPWGGGGTVSLRVGLLDSSDESAKALRARFNVG